jgi:putative addiction module component (TIGR02574 family)
MAQSDSTELLERALELEPAKRLSLAASLLDSVEEPDDEQWAAEWAKELDARLKSVESGEDPGETWETVKARALAGLGSG